MPHKEKASEELKLKLITSYISGKIGRNEAARQAGMTPTCFMTWAARYRAEGIQGLVPAERNKFYSEQLKKDAVEEYLSRGCSQLAICEKYSIRSRITLGINFAIICTASSIPFTLIRTFVFQIN